MLSGRTKRPTEGHFRTIHWTYSQQGQDFRLQRPQGSASGKRPDSCQRGLSGGCAACQGRRRAACNGLRCRPRSRLHDALSLAICCAFALHDLEHVCRLLNAFHFRSLKTRVTLFTLLIFLIGMWSLALYASELLRENFQLLLAEQQRATLTLISEEMDQELSDRVRALEVVAKGIGPATLADASAMQSLLERQTIFLGLFNGGTFVTDAQGTATASTPRSVPRVGVNYIALRHVASALQQGRSGISSRVLGKVLQVPLVSMVAPIRDAQGKVVGSLVGVIRLGEANFLDRISKFPPGKTGSYALIAPQERVVVASTDKSAARQSLPALGVNAGLDRILQGFEGSSVHTNAQGVRVLLSAKGLSTGGWVMAAELPTEEAFAPILAMQQRLLLATASLTLLSGLLTWWMLRRQLSPMLATAKQLSAMSNEQLPLRPLAVTRDDEVGQLIRGFNQLLAFLGQQEAALKDSEERFRTLTEWMPEAIAVHRDGKLLYVNPAAIKLLGASCAQQIVGKPILEFVHPEFRRLVMTRVQSSQDLGARLPALEEKFLKLDGSTIDVLVTGIVISYDGQRASQLVIRDITESLRAQAQMRKLSRIIEQAPMSIVITDLAGRIEYVNPWVSRVTGYSAQEILGKNPRVLQSGLTPPGVHQDLWKTLSARGVWRGEFHNQKKTGEVFVEQAVVAPVLSADGLVTHYVALKEDITERKRNEASLREHAEQLRALSRRVLEVQEAERRRLAVELHDELGQLLTAIKINLQSNERFRSQAPDELNVENIRIVEDALQQVRRLALALRPSMLDDLGLAPALRWMAGQNAQRGGFTTELYTDRLHDRLAPDIEIACFRIVQEALTNIARHARASQVHISLLDEGALLVLVVKDDGCGFDVAAMKAGALAGGSIGVLGMQERAALIGGQLEIESSPGHGSTLRMQCPMRLRADAP